MLNDFYTDGGIEVLESISDDELECFSDQDRDTSPQSSSVHTLVIWLIHLLALLQKKHYIPDTAIDFLLKLFATFLSVMCRFYPEISPIVNSFPGTLYRMRQILKIQEGSFIRYVTCPECSEVYTYDECIETCGSTKKGKKCKLCGSHLLKLVQTRSGARLLHPIRTYCYRPLRKSLQLLLERPNFYSDCEKWRNRSDNNMLSDVFDGKIWHDFQEYSGKPFLCEPFTFGLMMNVDWFKAYKHLEYKIGAIYLTVMNLPRELRFRQENMILVGLIPGPGEPQININSFLSPLVDELLEFLDGVPLKVHSFLTPKIIRCALLCVACDMPASRKVSGFLAHNAKLACTRCFKIFPGGFGEKRDYSGFDRSRWPSRSNSKHRSDVELILSCTVKTHREKKESELGCRYSVLLKLPYFDPIRMTITDPMHNLYLGTAKRILKKVWIEQNLISTKQFEVIQARVDSVRVPGKLGRIPSKIASSFSGFTADQFKNWTNIYSLFALRDILSTEDFECWRHFVLASRLLNQMQLSQSDVQLADALLLQFCKRVERMYGGAIITPNMHMHCHLKECILDYGTIYGFWLFSFERYNGIFESFPTNSCSLEVQCMQRFIREFSISTAHLPDVHRSDFSALLRSIDPVIQGSVKATLQPLYQNIVCVQQLADWTRPTGVVLPPSYILSALDQACISELQSLYSFLYPNFAASDITIHSMYHKYSKLEYCGTTYRSQLCLPGESSIVLVHHYCPSNSSMPKASPVFVHFFLKHCVTYNDQVYEHILLYVSWLKNHTACHTFGKPLQIWWKDLFQPNMFRFIPIQYILGNCAYTDIKYEEQSVLLLCPVQNIQLPPGV